MTEYDSEKAEIYADEMKLDVLTLRPVITELLKDVKDKKVLDFGCGSGRFSRLMAEYGGKVTALDVSNTQIELAKKINFHSNIVYEVGNQSKLNRYQKGLFDLILVNMVFPSLESPEEADKMITELSRLLKKEGKLIISILHPLHLHPIQRVNDRATDFHFKNYFREGHHYNSEVITTKNRIMHFRETHFSLNFISELLEKNRMYITKIKESKLIPEIECLVPVYLIFECTKLIN